MTFKKPDNVPLQFLIRNANLALKNRNCNGFPCYYCFLNFYYDDFNEETKLGCLSILREKHLTNIDEALVSCAKNWLKQVSNKQLEFDF